MTVHGTLRGLMNLQILSTSSPQSKDLLVDVRSRSALKKARIGSVGRELGKHPTMTVGFYVFGLRFSAQHQSNYEDILRSGVSGLE